MSQDSTIKADEDRTATMRGSGGEARVIGHYRLLQKLGEGGMGEVWEAEQTEPVQRRVAVKLIKRGMDSSQVIARFESERQALALMGHPAIAKVFDAGTTERGRPYFVMELAHGIPITQYCDRHRMTVRQRLELFIQVCEGIQHAHQKAIIHRDVKPSNILIAEQDGVPGPKIIDFGVAKATAQRLTERTLFTELGQLIGTPEYMSPEQAELTSEDVDIRTDVYSLGMVLYELLVGALPFDSRELRQAGLVELRQRIREEEPSKPSTQVTRTGDASALAARNRRTSVPSLVKSLRGDLDWIVMKALEKDRGRRYESAHALAQDIERCLHSQAIAARPPSFSYRAARFTRRHKLGVAAATFVLLALLTGSLLATIGLVQARRAEHRALAEAETSEEVLQFLLSLFEVSDPSQSRGDAVTARELLDKGALEVQEKLGERPEIQARLMDTIGQVYWKLEFYQEARPLFEAALRIREQHFGPDTLETAASMVHLSNLEFRQGNFDAAKKLTTGALEIRQQLLPATHPDIAESLHHLGVSASLERDFEKARDLYSQSLEIYELTLGPESLPVTKLLFNLAILEYEQSNYRSSRDYNERALDLIIRTEGEDHPMVPGLLNNLANTLMYLGDYRAAESALRESIALAERIYGADYLPNATSKTALGTLMMMTGYYDEARDLHEQALAARKEAFGPDHFQVGYSLNHLGILYNHLGDFTRAQAHLNQAIALLETGLGPEHPEVGYALTNLGTALTGLERFEESRAVLERGLALHETAFSSDDPELAYAWIGYAGLLAATGEYTEAARFHEKAYEVRRQRLPDDHVLVAECMNEMGAVFSNLGDYERAELLLGQSLDIQQEHQSPESLHLARVLTNYASLLEATGRADEAAPLRARSASIEANQSRWHAR
ncbi:MAG: tetratricopeptide repeat protein [Thermoanaerobaculia bacterium]